MAERHIVAMGGGGFSMESRNTRLDDFALSLARRKRRPRVCFVGTATGDSDSYIRRFHEAFPPSRAAATHLTFFERKVSDLKKFVMEQDVIYVGGGNTRNMLALWRLWGLDAVFREAHERGILLCGVSAGSICWFQEGVTDSWAGDLRPLECLGFLEGSNCPHYDGEPGRRPTYQRLVSSGAMRPGYAADDGVALHYRDGSLHMVVGAKPEAKAYRVERVDGVAIETVIHPTYLSNP